MTNAHRGTQIGFLVKQFHQAKPAVRRQEPACILPPSVIGIKAREGREEDTHEDLAGNA
jgi:hypothetical protein